VANLVYATEATLGHVARRVRHGANTLTRRLEEVAYRAVNRAEKTTATTHVVHVVTAITAAAAVLAATILAVLTVLARSTVLAVSATSIGHSFFLQAVSKINATQYL